MFGFGRKKDKKASIEQFEKETFAAWGVSRPTDEQKLRFRFSLACALGAIANEVGARSAKASVDKIFSEFSRTVDDLNVAFDEVFNIRVSKGVVALDAEMARDAYSLPKGRLRMNGLACLNCMLDVFGRDTLNWVYSRRNGPFGSVGAAALIVREHSVGEGNSIGGVSDMEFSARLPIIMKIILE